MAVRQDQVQVNVEINGTKAGSTLKELEGSAKQLRKELRQLPTDSEEFAKKAAELRGVNEQLKQISNTVKGVDGNLKDASGSSGFFKNALSQAAGVLTGLFSFQAISAAAGAIKTFFVNSIADARESNQAVAQLTQAYNGNTQAIELLTNQANALQDATKGLFTDEDILRAQTTLAIYTDEAENVEQLIPLILDLAAAKGVDLKGAADSVGKALEGDADALKKMGISVKDGATEQERLALLMDGLTEKVGGQAQAVADGSRNGWDRFKVSLGELSETAGRGLLPVLDSIGNTLAEIITPTKTATDAFTDQKAMVDDLEENVLPLINRYEELATKAETLGGESRLSKDEQNELNKAITAVSKTIPSAITQFDQYGNAIKLSADKAREFVQIQKDILLEKNRDAIQDRTNTLKSVEDQIALTQRALATRNEQGELVKVIITNARDGVTELKKLTDEEIRSLQTRLNELQQRKRGITGVIKELKGEPLTVTPPTVNDTKTVETIESLRKHLADLKKDFDGLATSNTTGIQQNLAAQATIQKQLDDLEGKTAEERRKKAEAEGKKLNDAEIKRKQDLAAKLIELQVAVEDAAIDAIKDGEQKEIAQENLRFARQQQAFTNRMNELRKLGASEAQIAAENEKFREDAEEGHSNKLLDIQIKYLDKRKQDKKKTDDELKKQTEDNYKTEVDATNEFYNGLKAAIATQSADKIEQVKNDEDAIKRIKEESAIAQQEIEIQRLEDLRRIAEENGKSTVELDQQIADQRNAINERYAQARANIEDAVKGTIKDGLEFAIQALSQDEQARKKNAALIKGFSISKVFVDLFEEIQAIWKTANANPSNILFPGSGTAIAAVKTALAAGRATVAVGKINQQQFAKGGFTGLGRMGKDDTGEDVAGVVHANEWVAPKWMVSHPAYNSVINQLEGIRVRGFAEGGFTTTPQSSITVNPAGGLTTEMATELITAVKALKFVQGVFTFDQFEVLQSDANTVRNSASIG